MRTATNRAKVEQLMSALYGWRSTTIDIDINADPEPSGFRGLVMIPAALIAGLPGEALVRDGLRDTAAGRTTIASCVVAMARSRLAAAGLILANANAPCDEPELELYRRLQAEGGDAYAGYNALVRELVSFESALEHRNRRRKAP